MKSSVATPRANAHPPDDVLLNAVMGRGLPPSAQAHIATCELCRGRIERERAANPVLADAASSGDEFWEVIAAMLMDR